MESSELQMALAAAVEEVLETMCFTAVFSSSDVVPGSEGAAIPQAGGGDPVIAALRFEGNQSGGFRVSIPMALARIIGSGFLGREEEEISDSQAEEVVCELANMFCGSVLSRLEKETIFHLSHPELVGTGAGLSFSGKGTSRWFDLEGGILGASLEFQQAS